jgi:3D (Asp-Asp-Asp) domain-containing protein
VSAYCPCERCCGKKPGHPAYGITTSGTRADHPLVAAPPEFPFGTVMTISGYGTVKVEDRGGAIQGDRLDVLFMDHESALQWGVQYLDVVGGR